MNLSTLSKQDLILTFQLFAELYQDPQLITLDETNYSQLIKGLNELLIGFSGDLDQIDYKTINLSAESISKDYEESLRNLAPPIESLYKQWTKDPNCNLPFARDKGYLLGDSALHIRYLLEEFDIKIQEQYINKPDHLIILLELLVLFSEVAPTNFVAEFVDDHFDWLEMFQEKLSILPENNFYSQLTKALAKTISLYEGLLKEDLLIN